MGPYFVFLTVVILLAYLSYSKDKVNSLWMSLLFLVMSLFSGFRSLSVGTDAGGYARGFEESLYQSRELSQGLSVLTDEPGFYYLQKLLGSISSEYVILFTGIAMVFCFFVLRSINQQSVAPILSLFVFITLGYYTFVFNAARQGLAMAIYMMSIPYLVQKRFLPYAFVVLIAALFHKTIIIAIPLYFFFTMKYSSRSLALAIGGGLVIGYLLPTILSYGATLENRYALYTEGNATGGYLLTLFYVALAAFFINQRKHMNSESLPRYDVFLHMLVAGSAIYLVVALTGAYVELTRFAAYFQIACIFLWSMLAKERRVPLELSFFVVVIIGHLVYFAIFLNRIAGLTPYMMNPNLF